MTRGARTLTVVTCAIGLANVIFACLGDPPPVASKADGGNANDAQPPFDGSSGGLDAASDAGSDALAAHCTNGMKDPSETDLDCGGDCATCSNGKSCMTGLDCASGACVSGKCAVWARTLGSATGDDFVTRALFDPSGDLVIVGYIQGAGDLGKDASAAVGSVDAFVAKYKRTGEAVWVKRIGFSGTETRAYGLAIAPNGTIAVGGNYSHSITVDGRTLLTPASIDAFVMLLDPSGTVTQAKGFGGNGNDDLGALAFDPAGDLFVSGNFPGDTILVDGVDYGNSSPGSYDFYVGKLSGADLTALWFRTFGSADAGPVIDELADMAALGSDVVLAGIYFQGAGLSLGGATCPQDGDWDTCVGRFSGGDGGHVWSRHIGGGGFNDQAWAIAGDPGGNVVVAGWASQFCNLGNGPLSATGGAYAVKYAPDGGFLWSRVGVPDVEAVTLAQGLSIDARGTVAISGTFSSSSLDFGLPTAVTPTPDSGSPDPFVAIIGADSGTTFASAYWTGLVDGGPDTQAIRKITVDRITGDVVVFGFMAAPQDFGSGAIVSRGGYDGFVASLGRLP